MRCRLKDVSLLSPQYKGENLQSNISFVPMECIRTGVLSPQEIPFAEGINKYTFFADGDLLIAKVTPCFENGNIAVASNLLEGIGVGSSELFVLRVNTKKLDTWYLFYLAQSSIFKDSACATMCGVAGLKRISPLFMRTFGIDLPSLAEQSHIVTYLDTKISAIDSRISLLKQKCEVYERLKKSIINDVITRGLNQNVKMKDSGVEYLGMIPETWKLLRFKELFKKYTTGVTPPSKDNTMFEMSEDAGYTWVTIADMTEKHVCSGKLRLSEKAKKQYNPVLTRKGSLLFSFKLTIGKVCFAEDDFYTNEAIISIPPTKKCSLDYMYHILPRLLQKNATENVYGAPMLNQKIIANLVIPIPPIEEQMAISEYINSKCAKIDSAISILNAQIEKYKLLKRSLINEVITGQRKVD